MEEGLSIMNQINLGNLYACVNVNLKLFIDRLKPILKFRENPPHPTLPHPNHLPLWTNFFSAISRPIFIKLSGYLPDHILTWFMMSKMTPSSKPQVKNSQCPSSPKLWSDLNHVGSSSNFQDIFLIICWHDLWCQRWPPKSPVRNLQCPPSPN